jgi:hypothetical protein
MKQYGIDGVMEDQKLWEFFMDLRDAMGGNISKIYPHLMQE